MLLASGGLMEAPASLLRAVLSPHVTAECLSRRHCPNWLRHQRTISSCLSPLPSLPRFLHLYFVRASTSGAGDMISDRFSWLPAELRNAIWTLVLSDPVQDSLPINITAPEPPITRSCRLIRYETLPLYYGRLYGFHSPIAQDDGTTAPENTKTVLRKWISTRATTHGDNSERLKWVNVVYVPGVTSSRRILRRGWSQDNDPSGRSSSEFSKLKKLLPVAFGDAHDFIGIDVMSNIVSCREGLSRDKVRARYHYLYLIYAQGLERALQIWREPMEEEEEEEGENGDEEAGLTGEEATER